MKKFMPFIINALFVICFYFGFVENVEGARNLALFYIWTTIAVVLVTAAYPDEEAKRIEKAKQPNVMPRSIHITIHFAVLIGLLWYGWWITAVFYVIAVAMIHKMWEDKDKLKAKLAAEQASKF